MSAHCPHFGSKNLIPKKEHSLVSEYSTTMIPQPHIIIFLGAILVVLGSTIAAVGGYIQQKQQIDFERTTRTQLEETIKSVIGGDSYCYVSLEAGFGWISNLTISCNGDYPMYDVFIRLYDPDDFTEMQPRMNMEDFLKKDIFSADVGNIGVGSAKTFPMKRQVDMNGRDRKVFRAEIHARNGFFQEDFILKQVGNHWLRALRVFKGFSNDLVHEWADQNFPRDNEGNILWDN